ncbi:hypothetical protein Q0601_00875 [Paracoccus onubensis]|uniref:hypothetical protein n=1 Tax=Paracoccus onubensis TaxID=1675788 RepID=UPI002731E2BC|nr:hypothetical protein [Paracoccus onubensis]MDP0925715.1 hypothetical protein [Paracoccus onubensis]
MALSFPYALDFLANCMIGERVPLRLQRNDEMSGSGDGRYWSAELARPLWTASYSLYAKQEAHAREMNAKVWGLDGMSKTMLWADPNYRGPASGVTTGLGGVSVSSVRADRGALSLTGLPVGFTVTAGDFLSIAFGTYVYFGAFVEGGTAGAGGDLGSREVRPFLPMGIQTQAVELVRPYFKAIVTEYQPFASTRWHWGDSASISILQRP